MILLKFTFKGNILYLCSLSYHDVILIAVYLKVLSILLAMSFSSQFDWIKMLIVSPYQTISKVLFHGRIKRNRKM